MMRTRWAGLAALGVLCAVTACSGNNSNGAGSAAPASPSATGGGMAGTVPACVLGSWRSTATTASGSRNGVTGTVSGGQGVLLTIGADGATRVDLSSMQPMDFTATAAVGSVKGQYSYAGAVRGTLRFPGAASQGSGPPPGPSLGTESPSTASGTATPPVPDTGSAASGPASSSPPEQTGTWQPAADVNWDDLRLTLKLTAPISQTLVDNARIPAVGADQTGQTGDVVDLQPILRNGTYSCSGGTLTLRPERSTAAVTWTFQRA